MTKRSENAVKMQKLRRAVDRLRNLRSAAPPPQQKETWLERLKTRLGLAANAERRDRG
ncbi:MAG: hypothetical protein ACP5JG_07645 [Anaerolineae bacterium]